MERLGELIGIIVYSYPAVRASGRKKAVGYAPDIEELNRDWSVISRVIVHPKYRTIGLGSRLVSETLPIQGCSHVELIAVMAQYNPFAERAGMRLIQVTEPHQSIAKAVEELRELGFNPIMMASVEYNRDVLEGLDERGIESLSSVLLGVGAIYYKRLARTGRPYLRRAEFGEWLVRQPTGSLARTLAVLNTLNQTKAYLYWCRDWWIE
jgi:GNAT superfamily N-acetyltransferase